MMVQKGPEATLKICVCVCACVMCTWNSFHTACSRKTDGRQTGRMTKPKKTWPSRRTNGEPAARWQLQPGRRRPRDSERGERE